MTRLLCWLFGHGKLNPIAPIIDGSTMFQCRRCGEFLALPLRLFEKRGKE